MKRIIVTGATSMIGTALIETAVRNQTEVYAVVRPDTSRIGRIAKSPLVHTIEGTLERMQEIDAIPGDCDALFHFAWAGTGRSDRDDPELQEKNIRYTLEAVELAEKCGCKRFVGAGSQAEYGPVYEVIDEDTKCAPAISYGIAKYSAGILSRKLCERKNIAHVWGRIFSVYGPHDNKGTMLDYAIDCFQKGETAKFSSAVQSWNYLYEADAGEMFYRLGEAHFPTGTWLIANPESMPLRSYIETMMEVYGNGAKAEFAPQNGMPAGLNVNMSRTLAHLHYLPQVRFRDGIRKMIESKRMFNTQE